MASDSNSNHFLSCPVCASSLVFSDQNYSCINQHNFPVQDGIICLTHHQQKNKLTLAQQSGAWKSTAFLYEKIWRPYSLSILTTGKFSTADELEHLKKFVSVLKPETVVVDLTCSSGFYGRNISESRPDLTILYCDYSIEMLKAAKKKNRANYDFYISTWAENQNFSNESIDAFVCGGSWNEITETEKTLKVMFQSLKKDGVFFWMGILKSEKIFGKFSQKIAQWLGGLHFDSPHEVETHFRSVGFKNIELKRWKSVFIITGKK